MATGFNGISVGIFSGVVAIIVVLFVIYSCWKVKKWNQLMRRLNEEIAAPRQEVTATREVPLYIVYPEQISPMRQNTLPPEYDDVVVIAVQDQPYLSVVHHTKDSEFPPTYEMVAGTNRGPPSYS